MSDLRAAAQQALEALSTGVRAINHLGGAREAVPLHDAIVALRAALAAPEQEPVATVQPRLTVRLSSFPESNGKRNWTALLVRVDKWGGLVGNCGGITIERGELWNRVAYEAERAKLLIGERDTEPHVLDYGDDITTPDQWAGEVRGGRPEPRRLAAAPAAPPQREPQWVPVAERLPPSGQTVLACYVNRAGRLRRIRAEWIAAKSVESSSEHSDIGVYDEDTDTFYDPEGWYERIDNWGDYSAVGVCEGDVTHWMPLPDAPASAPKDAG